MPKIPGVNHLQAVRALEKAGFQVIRQGKHIITSDGIRQVVIPRIDILPAPLTCSRGDSIEPLQF